MNRDFIGALLQLNAEKGVPQEILLQTLEQAIESAYRRNAEAPENVVVKIDPETGEISVFREYEVVAGTEEVEDPELQKTVAEAVEIEEGVGVGSRVRIPENVTQQQLGRIAAQTAGQVYRQRLREAERDVVYHQYVSREGEILTGVVTRTTESAVVLDMSRGVEAVLSVSEQLPGEHYRIGQHLKVFVLEVRRTTRGPVLVVSRTHRGFLRRLMEMEIPEIYNGSVVIRGIAREAGSRSKVAVESRQPGVDAKGAAVGQRGTRIQAIVAELNGEKVDVVLWNEDASPVRGRGALAGRGHRGPDRRGAPHRQRDRSRAPAVAGHRPRGAERPAGGQAHRLADRHPLRRGRGGGRRRGHPRCARNGGCRRRRRKFEEAAQDAETPA